jgi:hypothetical protein
MVPDLTFETSWGLMNLNFGVDTVGTDFVAIF